MKIIGLNTGVEVKEFAKYKCEIKNGCDKQDNFPENFDRALFEADN